MALRQTPDRAEQRALTRRLVAREHDQVPAHVDAL